MLGQIKNRTHSHHLPAALCLIIAAAGCSSVNQIDSWPIVYTDPESDRFPGRTEFIGPFIDIEWKDSTAQWGLRPLFSVRQYRDIPLDRQPQYDVPFFAPPAILSTISRQTPPHTAPGQGHSALQVLALWPLFSHESSGPVSRTYFIPLYYNVRDNTTPGNRWHQWAFFPLYFGGNSDKSGPYHALFPVGGVVKNMFGRDRIDFVLFPLYMHTAVGERHSYNFIWPIFNYAHGGGRDGWYVWPIIGRMARQDNPPRWFFLWPFFWYTEPPAEGERPTRATVFFPFFGWQERDGVRITNIIWPLYSHTKNTNTGQSDYVVPWPVLRIGSGPDYSRFQVWPLIGFYSDKRVSRQYYLWPLARFEQRRTEDSSMTGQSLLIIYRATARTWQDSRSQTRSDYENILWPLWSYKRDGQGNTYFCVIEPRGVPDPQGYDRFYAFIWRIFERESRTSPDDQARGTWRSTRALWQAFRYDSDNQSSFLRVFPALTCRRHSGRFTSFELLAGMFGFIDKPGTRTYRVLFIPWSVKRSENQP